MMSDYGRGLYADIITKRNTTVPGMYLVLCSAPVLATDTGATIVEASPRQPLAMGTGGWSITGTGLRTYAGNADMYLDVGLPTWGTVTAYAIVDSATAGTGHVLFYGSFTPVTMVAPMIMSFTDLEIEVPA